MAIAISVATLASCNKATLDEEVIAPEIETKSFDVSIEIVDEVGLESTEVTLFDQNGVSISTYIVTDAEWTKGPVHLSACTKLNPSFIQCPNAEGTVFLPSGSVMTKAVTPATLVLNKP